MCSRVPFEFAFDSSALDSTRVAIVVVWATRSIRAARRSGGALRADACTERSHVDDTGSDLTPLGVFA
jgi:hypothetical protein